MDHAGQPRGPDERARQAVRFTTLDALRTALGCRPGDLIRHVPDDEASRAP